MKVYINTDLEGVACVVGEPGITLTQSKQYEWARRILTGEVIAAVEGAKAAGATEILVSDGHGGGLMNMHYEDLPDDVRVIVGTGRPRKEIGLDETFEALLLVGYHPMAGTSCGVLSHTYSSMSIQRMLMHGEPVGEMALSAALAGQLGVPVVFVSSCKAGCEEARRFFGERVVTVAVKEGVSRNAAISLTPQAARARIREGVEEAVRRCREIEPFTFPRPYELTIEYKLEHHAQARAQHPRAELVDPLTVVLRGDDLFELY